MPKLRYKDHDKKEKKQHHKHRAKDKRHKKEKPYKPPTLYEEEGGWIPPATSYKDDEEESAWRAHLFDAMMDDEGQDPFYSSYNEYSNNSSQPALMTDEEYRQYIVDGMYRRKNADKIAEEERQKAAKRKEQKEREKRRREEERRESERIRLENIVRQSEKLKKIEATHIEYDNKWKRLEEDMSKILHKKDIPWPIVGKEFSLESLKSFVIDSRLTSEENKKNVRKEQTRYHPDKFITRYMKRFEGSEKEKDTVLKRINEISSWLNEIWSQISNKN